jgi:hypothetical protein
VKALRRAARAFGDTFGRRSLVVTALRPMYDAVLSWSSAGRGIEQTLNGRETVRVDPRYRVHFPDRYEPEVCQYLRDNVRAGSVAMNVGAHVGVCALCLAQWAGPRGKVFAFEPNPFTRDVLVRHVAMNGFGDRIQVVDEAISDHVGIQPAREAESRAVQRHQRRHGSSDHHARHVQREPRPGPGLADHRRRGL